MKKSWLYVMVGVVVGCSAASQDLGSSDPNAADPGSSSSSGGTSSEEDPGATSSSSSGGSGRKDAGTSSSSGGSSSGGSSGSTDAGKDTAVDPPIVPNAKRVFETSGSWNGNLKAEGGGTTGPDGADKLCAGAALAASLGGTWKAWISAPGDEAADRIADVSPWYFVDKKTKVFDTKMGLGQGALVPSAAGIKVGPLVDINMNELGTTNSPKNDWTGTLKTGKVSPFACNGFTNSQSVNGYEGLVGIGISFDLTWWTDSSTNPCATTNRLICFEQ